MCLGLVSDELAPGRILLTPYHPLKEINPWYVQDGKDGHSEDQGSKSGSATKWLCDRVRVT